jgi:hypothetical protein
MKKLLAVPVSICLAIGMAGPSFAVRPPYDEGIIVNDIEGHWAKPAIIKLYQTGIGKGDGDCRYTPDQNFTGERMVPSMNTGVAGYGMEFRPRDTLIRGEAAALIARLVDRLQASTGGQAMAVKRVDLSKADASLQAWVAEKITVPGIYSKTVDGKTYILVSRGEKPNLGYGISIAKVVEKTDRIEVTAELRNPQPGMMYGQRITTPYDLVEITETYKPVQLKDPIN